MNAPAPLPTTLDALRAACRGPQYQAPETPARLRLAAVLARLRPGGDDSVTVTPYARPFLEAHAERLAALAAEEEQWQDEPTAEELAHACVRQSSALYHD